MAGPLKKIQIGNVSIDIWQNSIKKEGNDFIIPSVTIQKGYKKPDGSWGNSTSLGVNDIPKAIIGLQKAYEILLEKGD